MAHCRHTRVPYIILKSDPTLGDTANFTQLIYCTITSLRVTTPPTQHAISFVKLLTSSTIARFCKVCLASHKLKYKHFPSLSWRAGYLVTSQTSGSPILSTHLIWNGVVSVLFNIIVRSEIEMIIYYITFGFPLAKHLVQSHKINIPQGTIYWQMFTNNVIIVKSQSFID